MPTRRCKEARRVANSAQPSFFLLTGQAAIAPLGSTASEPLWTLMTLRSGPTTNEYLFAIAITGIFKSYWETILPSGSGMNEYGALSSLLNLFKVSASSMDMAITRAPCFSTSAYRSRYAESSFVQPPVNALGKKATITVPSFTI